jgi:hypothetical protein
MERVRPHPRGTTQAPSAASCSPVRTLGASALLLLAVPACVLLISGVPARTGLVVAATSIWDLGSDFARPLAVTQPGFGGRAKMQGLANELLSKRGDTNPDKVLVQMFMEADCPDCRRFTTTYLAHILSADGVGDIIDLEWVPFGQAKTMLRVITVEAGRDRYDVVDSTDGLESLLDRFHDNYNIQLHGKPKVSFTCAHGEAECEGNAWRSCLLDVAPRHQDSFPAFKCMEEKACDWSQDAGCNPQPGDVAHYVSSSLPASSRHTAYRLSDIFFLPALAVRDEPGTKRRPRCDRSMPYRAEVAGLVSYGQHRDVASEPQGSPVVHH